MKDNADDDVARRLRAKCFRSRDCNQSLQWPRQLVLLRRKPRKERIKRIIETVLPRGVPVIAGQCFSTLRSPRLWVGGHCTSVERQFSLPLFTFVKMSRHSQEMNTQLRDLLIRWFNQEIEMKFMVMETNADKGKRRQYISLQCRVSLSCVASVSVDTRLFDFRPRENCGERKNLFTKDYSSPLPPHTNLWSRSIGRSGSTLATQARFRRPFVLRISGAD